MSNIEQYIDEALTRSVMAKSCEIPAEKWREVLFEAKAACLIRSALQKYKDEDRLSLAYPCGYAELREIIESTLNMVFLND
jgi:hypothetical protein